MNRLQKKEWVKDVNTCFLNAGIVIVVHYKGMNVAEMESLRSAVREAGASFRVTKNRLTKIALEGTAYTGLSDLFTGPTAVAYSDDPVSAAKVLSEFAKKNENLVLLGGAFGENILDIEGINKLAKLPSLDELRAKIISLINTPATRIAGVTQAPAGQLARVFGAYGSSE